MSGHTDLRFPVNADPELVQDSLVSFLRVRRVALEMRAEEGHTWPLSRRVAFASSVLPTIDGWIYAARAWLAAKGLPCRKASAAGASMAQGCAALSPAVGPAPVHNDEAHAARVGSEGSFTAHADPLSVGQPGQSLPAVVAAGNTAAP